MPGFSWDHSSSKLVASPADWDAVEKVAGTALCFADLCSNGKLASFSASTSPSTTLSPCSVPMNEYAEPSRDRENPSDQ